MDGEFTQFKIRMASPLFDHLRAMARRNKLSVTAEIIKRLNAAPNADAALRDEFAGKAMQSFIAAAGQQVVDDATQRNLTMSQLTAEDAYTMADAMLAARDRP